MCRVLLLVAFVLSPAVLRAQPSPTALLRDWGRGQMEAEEALEELACTEVMTWVVDGAFGRRETRLEAYLRGRPGGADWTREIRDLRVNGEPVPRERWDPVQRYLGRLLGRPGGPGWRGGAALLGPGMLPLGRLLARGRPAGPVRTERLGEVEAWRVEVIPPGEPGPGPVERVTLWFDPATQALLRSRTILQPAGSTLVATVDYERREGLDLPVARHVEGTLRTRRRGQSFTQLFTLEASYRDCTLHVDER